MDSPSNGYGRPFPCWCLLCNRYVCGEFGCFRMAQAKRQEGRFDGSCCSFCLICGDGLWLLPSFILALFKVRPPICMSFFATT
ncbi:hypothetical protein HRI_002517000 [Hibiscus trionum]|uniref:Uncharacterized protein n=1 Tax=Hibiscus trionum TaxID=183268 RepID=A0A9W7I3Z9_HIBTR|nr:hypothetical protein HRI_002517000 [Hibiscus trionum]